METKKKKEWVKPELKVITEIDVHENVLATSVIIRGDRNPDGSPKQG